MHNQDLVSKIYKELLKQNSKKKKKSDEQMDERCE